MNIHFTNVKQDKPNPLTIFRVIFTIKSNANPRSTSFLWGPVTRVLRKSIVRSINRWATTERPRERKKKGKNTKRTNRVEGRRSRNANRPERKLFRTGRDEGWGGGGLHEFIISVAVHPSVIPSVWLSVASYKSKSEALSRKSAYRIYIYGEGTGCVCFHSVCVRSREGKKGETAKLGQATTHKPSSSPLRRVIQVETAIRVFD